MAKTIVFIDNFDEVEIFFETFESCNDKDTTYIAGDAFTLAALKKKGIECKPLDDYRNPKEYEESEYSAVELAGKWFVDYEGNDLTEFEGISIGKCLKKDTYHFFDYLLKAILDVSNILKYENPEKVFLVNDYSISTEIFGKGSLNLHKKAFQFLKKDKKYDVYIGGARAHRPFLKRKNILRHLRFERHALAGRITYYCPAILNRFIKKLAVIAVDQLKRLLSKNINKLGAIRALTLSASDFTYFGNDLVQSYLRKGNCYLYYFEDENNCYFNSRIIRALARQKASSTCKKKAEYMSVQKNYFEKFIASELSKPKLVFKDLPLIYFIEDYLRELFYKKIPALNQFSFLAKEVIRKYKINIVLICERKGAKRIILTQIAKRNGLSVLHIPHSIEPGFKDGEKIISHLACDIKHFLFYPTHEVSGFKYHLQLQERRGISHSKLFLTGIPRFGKFTQKNQEMFYNARKRLGFSQNDEIILFAIRAIFKPFYDKAIRCDVLSTFELLNFYELFLKQFLLRKNSKVVFKLKMLDVGDRLINDFVNRNRMTNIKVFRNHLDDLLIASDAVVVAHSNIGIEALYHDTPVIVYNNPHKPSLLPLCAEKAAIEIKSPQELTPVLDRLRNDKGFKEERLKIQREFLQRNLPDDDLSPAERVVNVITQLALKTC